MTTAPVIELSAVLDGLAVELSGDAGDAAVAWLFDRIEARHGTRPSAVHIEIEWHSPAPAGWYHPGNTFGFIDADGIDDVDEMLLDVFWSDWRTTFSAEELAGDLEPAAADAWSEAHSEFAELGRLEKMLRARTSEGSARTHVLTDPGPSDPAVAASAIADVIVAAITGTDPAPSVAAAASTARAALIGLLVARTHT